MFYMLCVGATVVLGLLGLWLVYFFDFTKEVGGVRKFHALGAFMDVIGGVLLIVCGLSFYVLTVKTGDHASYRHLARASEGQFTVADRLRSAKKTDKEGGKEDWVSWTPVSNGTPLWYAVNVYTEEVEKPNTDVLSSEQTEYGPLPTKWTKVVVWYGTAQGPSIPHEIVNPNALKSEPKKDDQKPAPTSESRGTIPASETAKPDEPTEAAK